MRPGAMHLHRMKVRLRYVMVLLHRFIFLTLGYTVKLLHCRTQMLRLVVLMRYTRRHPHSLPVHPHCQKLRVEMASDDVWPADFPLA